MKTRIVAAAIAAALIGGGIYMYAGGAFDGLMPSRTAAKKKGGDNRPVPVIVAAVEKKTVPVTIETIGQIQAFATVSVKSRVDGQVMEVYFRDGQLVKKGAPLFTIDPRPFKAKVLEMEANLARDRAQLANATADLSRYTQLSKSGYSSQQKYDQARATAEALEAAVKADLAAIERARLDLEFTAIRAPIDGRVGSVLVDAGNLIKANDVNPLVVINQVKPIYVAFSVPEQNLPTIKRRMADGALQVEVHVPGSSDPAERGRVVFVNNAVDAATGTIQLKAELANEHEQLTSGQFVRVSLIMREIADALLVPSQSVQNGQAGSFIYVVQPDRRVALRNVTVGPSWQDWVVIEKGIAAGDTVVTEGQLRLRPGARVSLPREGGGGSGGADGADGAAKGKPAS